MPGAVLALILTIAIDSYFWRSSEPLWPELSAFLSNVFPKQGSLGASAWGTQPFYWYLLSALPRLLMNQIAMIDLFFSFSSTLNDLRVLDNLVPSYAYLLVYSLLPHKELRFMFPIVPPMTLIAALTCTRLTINAHKSAITKIFLYGAAVSTIITAVISHAILLPLSAQNYPGGNALQTLHNFYHIDLGKHIFERRNSRTPPEVRVHLTNLALQSGVTRFLEQPSNSMFTTEERLSLREISAESDHNEELEPIILQGDANHPALTIRPKAPLPSDSSQIPFPEESKWLYDKSSNDTAFQDSSFWDQFDFAIVEDPLIAMGQWQVIQEIKAVGRPKLLTPDNQQGYRYVTQESWTTPDELWSYWTTPDRLDEEEGTTALLHKMYPPSIASPLAKIHNVAHDVFRLGRWSPIGSVTKGYWFELPLTTKLYIIKRVSDHTKQQRSSNPNQKQAGAQFFPSADIVDNHDNARNLELPEIASTDQKSLGFDKLGPLVVNKDGTLSRLDNWQQMTEQERKKTMQYLKKRNMLRIDQVEAVVA